MEYLQEATVRDVLVEAVRQNGGNISGAIEAAVAALIAANKTLSTPAAQKWQDAKAPPAFQMPYPPVTDLDTVGEMMRTGDTFIRHLAAAWGVADANNRKRIRTTWGDEFRKFATLVHYQVMARQSELEGRN